MLLPDTVIALFDTLPRYIAFVKQKESALNRFKNLREICGEYNVF